MNALEEEVLRLRAEKDYLNEVAANWKRCTLALLSAEQAAGSSSRPPLHLGPGVFFWMVSGVSEDWPLESEQPQLQITKSQSQEQSFTNSLTNHLSELGLEGELAAALLQNCRLEIPFVIGLVIMLIYGPI
jgi:hypothetical protein